VDYFINKDAKAFLEEQFDLWMYQYIFKGESRWTEPRIKQLQTLRDIAFKIIAFISQFENELVKIWNKPKFVLNSNYVITLDRIAEKDIAVVEKLLAHKNFKAQVEEWRELGIVDKSFKKADVLEQDGKGKRLAAAWQHLPVDTKHFKDLELEILGLFDNLDALLDGWFIKSENYQALNTILPKFRERVKCIYIDPPYNTGNDEFIYRDQFRHSSWLTMMENRLTLAKECLRDDSVIFVSCDFHEHPHLVKLMEEVHGRNAFVATFHLKVRHEGRILTGDKEVQEVMEQVLCFKNPLFEIGKIALSEKREEYRLKIVEKSSHPKVITLGGKRIEIFTLGQYEIIESKPGEGLLKPISIRGTIRKGNSSGRFFVSQIEGRYPRG
jgi:adenine specific DNA methylase Mod